MKVISAKHPKSNYFDLANFECVTEDFHHLNPRTALRENDVLISTVGTIGNSAVVDSEMLPANSDRHVGIIRIRENKIRPLYLSTFLNSEYGRIQSFRESTGNVQLNLFISKINTIIIPRFSDEFEGEIAETVLKAKSLRSKGAELTKQAEALLLSALGLEQWQPPEALTYERSAKEVFEAGRLDAEYFAPKIAELLERLKADGQSLEDVAPARHERFSPDKNANFQYIEIGGIKNDGTAEADTVAGEEAPSRATWYVHSGDVITSTVRPIRRLSAIIAPEQAGNVCSSGFVVLKPQEIPSEVLLTFLRLPYICQILDLRTSASLYPALSERDLMTLPVPKFSPEITEAVVENVRQARGMRERSTQLLEMAKRAVEMAIEESEAAALAYLESEGENGE